MSAVVAGQGEAQILADTLRLPWVRAGSALPSDATTIVACGPIGWTIRTTAGHDATVVWRPPALDLPISRDTRWALSRIDHVVAVDEETSSALAAVGCEVTLIPPRVAPLDPPDGPPAVARIGAVASSPNDDMLGAVLAAARLAQGSLGTCRRCGRAVVGRFDPWKPALEPPSCCARVELLAPLSVSVSLGWFGEKLNPAVLDHFLEWVRPLVGADVLAIRDAVEARDHVRNWSAVVSVEARPGIQLGRTLGQAAGIPTIAVGAPELDLPLVTRVTAGGHVRRSLDPVATVHVLHDWLTSVESWNNASAKIAAGRIDDESFRRIWDRVLRSRP